MNTIGQLPNPASGMQVNANNQVQNVAYGGQAFSGMAYNAASIPTGILQQSQHAGPASHAALYVGDLHPDVNEAALFEKFSPFGALSGLKVCREYISLKSLNYGYVNFIHIEDAEKAMDHLNFEELIGKQMRIMWSQRDPALRKSGQGNVFIKNLDKVITNRELYDTFSVFGDILSCKIATDENGISKGYGFVHFKIAAKAAEAIKKLDGKIINGKTVSVVPFIPRVERQKLGMGAVRFNNVFTKNFTEDYDDEKLRALFVKFGNITSLKVVKNEQGLARGFGFVCFEKHEEARLAVEKMNNYELPSGKILYVGRSQKKAERAEVLKNMYEKKKRDKLLSYSAGVNLYVKNLDDSVDDVVLREAFKEHGEITSAKVMTDHAGISKGFGFVCFRVREDAATAVTEMNGRLVKGKPLYVALAQRKEERRVQLATTFNQRTLTGQRIGNYAPMPGVPELVGTGHMPGFGTHLSALFSNVNNPVGHRPNYPMQNLAFNQQRPRWPAMANYRPPAQPVMQSVQPQFRSAQNLIRNPNSVGGLSPSAVSARPLLQQVPANQRAANRVMPVQYTNQARNVQRPEGGAGDGPVYDSLLTKESFLNQLRQRQGDATRVIGEYIYSIMMTTYTGDQMKYCGKVIGIILHNSPTQDLIEIVQNHFEDPSADSRLMKLIRENVEAFELSQGMNE